MANVFAIFLGAGFGGVLRYLLTLALKGEYHGHFPLPTFVINITGCFAIGFLTTFFEHAFPIRQSWALGITVGVLGGFTTFSTFGRETFILLGEAKPLIALWYVLASNVIGVALAFAGHMLAKSMQT